MLSILKLGSRLHSKGIFILSLLVLSESVTFCNAVSEMKDLRHKISSHFDDSNNNNNKKQRQAEESSCPITGDRSACPAAPPALPFISPVYPRGRLLAGKTTVKRYADDCCAECSNCMDPAQAAKMCHIPRGGHSIIETAPSPNVIVEGGAGVAKLPYGIPLHLWKVIFQAILTAINVLCWLVPLKSKKISDNKLALSLANAFSGGVFLSLAFGHLIPECVHGFDASLPEVAPYLLVLAGYLLIFFVEKVAFDAHEIMHEMEHGDLHKKNKEKTKTSTSNGDATAAAVGGRNGRRSAVILLGALAVHSILEMMALGLSDSFGDCALLTLSIALHQPAESIALLVAFLKSGMPKGEILRFLSIFSCMGPIGVGLGMAVNEFAAPIVDAVMLAIVAGTFVYVGATEVIPEEWEDPSHKWKKFGALMSGIVSILVITQYTMSLGS